MAETTGAAPASYKQPSRKGKKAWRKNVDITEVQTGLENVRDEIIRGGVLAEANAADLFSIDVAGDSEIQRKQDNKKLLKVDEILSQRSSVPGLEGRKRKVAEIPEPSNKRPRDGKYVSHRELERLKKVADNATGGVAIEEPAASHDPWAAPAPPKHADLTFLEQKKPKVEPKTLRHAPVSLAANHKAIPSVRKPEAGKSYNPLVSDWSALLEREGAAAVSAEQARAAAEAEEEARQARAEAEAKKVEAQEKEDWATDYESAWESEWEGIQSGDEGAQREWTVKQQRRKTPAERNKIKARKEREQREKWERKQKEREAQEARIKSIAKEMSAKDRAKLSLAVQQPADDSSSDDGREPELAKRRFGKRAVPEAPLEVVLPDELQDSLRRLKPEGNLLTDRYRNLLLNGKVEVRKRLGDQKKKKVDRTEKWSYKDWKLK